MPGVQYKGLAARFADPWFAWRLLGSMVLTLCIISIWIIANSDEVPGERRVLLRSDGTSAHMGPKPVVKRFQPQANACDTREITWAEFLKHGCDSEDLWLVIDGHVYDLWPWGMQSHPGGSIICQGAGTDSSEVFEAIHPDYVRQMLPERCIGRMVDPQ